MYGYPLKVNVTDIDFSNIHLLSRLPRCVETLVLSENKHLPVSFLYNLVQSSGARYIKEIDISNTCLTSIDCNSTYTGIFALVYLFDQMHKHSCGKEIYQLINLKKIVLLHYYCPPFHELINRFKNSQIMPMAPNLECVVFRDYIWET